MESKELDKRYRNICRDISDGRIRKAIYSISRLLREEGKGDYLYRLENLSANYKSLLNYAFKGYRDPRQQEILGNLCISLLSLADEVYHEIREKELVQTKLERILLKKEFGDDPDSIPEKIDSLIFGKEVDKILDETGTPVTPVSPAETLFKLIWLTPRWNDGFYSRIHKLAGATQLEWHEKSLVVSAVTLSILDYFEPRKILSLLDFIESGEPRVYQRALTGLVIALKKYDDRLKFYPEILNRLSNLTGTAISVTDIQAILLQILMAQETEKINKAFEEEVLPGMREVMPKLEDKLELGNIFEESDIEGKNPEWKDLIEEVPGLFESIEKFTKMQIEGADVFMSTFSLLKRFDFFTRISNWFMPFYAGHPDLKGITVEDEPTFTRLLEGLEKAFYLCNSDKYSFALNFNAVPQQQRSRIVAYFEAELEQMKEMASEDEVLGQTESSATIFTQYIQDLYRFFKLFPFRNDFEDIFRDKIHFTQLNFYRKFFDTEKSTAQLAAFYFDREHYQEAIEMYEYLVSTDQPRGEYFEKIGYACQKLGQFEKAIEYYRKADLFEGNRLWVLKKLGWCCLKIKDWGQAVKYFESAALLQPDDLNLQVQIAHCYLNMKNFEQALNVYSKVSFFEPDNPKVTRPVAYCHFVLGKLDDAAGLYRQIIAGGNASPYDLMNAGHVQLCLGHWEESFNLYRQCIKGKSMTQETFRNAFEEDVQYLVRNGIRPEDIPLLTDALLFQFDEN